MPSMELKDSTRLHKPRLHSFERDGLRFFLDPESPNWIATDARGEAVEVCTDTASKLKAPPYAGHFLVAEPDGSLGQAPGAQGEAACCAPGKESCC